MRVSDRSTEDQPVPASPRRTATRVLVAGAALLVVAITQVVIAAANEIQAGGDYSMQFVFTLIGLSMVVAGAVRFHRASRQDH